MLRIDFLAFLIGLRHVEADRTFNGLYTIVNAATGRKLVADTQGFYTATTDFIPKTHLWRIIPDENATHLIQNAALEVRVYAQVGLDREKGFFVIGSDTPVYRDQRWHLQWNELGEGYSIRNLKSGRVVSDGSDGLMATLEVQLGSFWWLISQERDEIGLELAKQHTQCLGQDASQDLVTSENAEEVFARSTRWRVEVWELVSLSVDELRGLIGGGVFQLSGPDDIEQLLSWMDINQDGNVSFEEFLNVALEYGQISSRAESDEASTSFWAGLGLRGWGSGATAASIGASRSFQKPRGPQGPQGPEGPGPLTSQLSQGPRMEANGGQSFPKQPNPSAQDPRVWKLRVGILSAEGAPFIDPMQFHSAYVICSLCGEDPQSDAVELFRTHNVSYTGQASWNIEEDLLDYQPPDGLELSIVCQGSGKPDWLLGSARLQHRQFFPLGCNTRLTLVRGGEGIQGTLWVKILVMEDNGTPVFEGPLQDPSSAQWVGGKVPNAPNAGIVKTNGDGNKLNPGIQVTWGKHWVENRPPVVTAIRSQIVPPPMPMRPMPMQAVPQQVYPYPGQRVPMVAVPMQAMQAMPARYG